MYRFYDLVCLSKNARTIGAKLPSDQSLVFEGNTLNTGENLKRIENLFGGRLTGESSKKTNLPSDYSTSRYFKNSSFQIAGIEVPMKPVEPDNCCMSGCINCVWELYNDDLKYYKKQREIAAGMLKKTGGIWPLKYNPPVKLLNKENLPAEFRGKSQEEIEEYIRTQEEDGEDRWESISMDVFKKLENKLESQS